MLVGGSLTRPGACDSVLSDTFTGGPPNRPVAGAGGGPPGAVSCDTFAGPVACSPARFSTHSCAVSVGLTTEMESDFRSALSAANTSSGYVGLPDGRAELSIPTVPLAGS